MKYREVLEDARKELQEEKLKLAREEIKEKLREIELCRETLDMMESQLEEMLDDEF